MELRADPQRERKLINVTGILVRALSDEDGWGSYDIAELTRESLLSWLRSRLAEGEKGNPWAESTVLLMLGHETAPEGPR